MGRVFEAIRRLATDVFYWVFPREKEIPTCARALLESIYPGIDWAKVTFYDGIPWIFRLGNQEAITLPDTYAFRRINVYIRPGHGNPCACDGLRLLVHEVFHVLQYQNILNGWGIGLFRPFIIAYISCAVFQGGGRRNSLEIPAYEQALNGSNSLFDCCCSKIESTGAVLCDCSMTPPGLNRDFLQDLIDQCPQLVKTHSGLNFWSVLIGCTPGINRLLDKAVFLEAGRYSIATEENSSAAFEARDVTLGTRLIGLICILWVLVWCAIWTTVTGVIAVAKPLAELIILAFDGILWGVVRIADAIKPERSKPGSVS